MEYELYIDVLFLVNFMMDYLLLLMVRKILSCQASHWNLCVGSVVGAAGMCAVVILPVPHTLLRFVLLHALVNMGMLRAGLKIKGGKQFLRGLAALYTGSFLLGGIFEWMGQYVRTAGLFFASAAASYALGQGVWRFITYLQRVEAYRCKVTLYVSGKCRTVDAFVDTGNGLSDPLTREPVCILGKRRAEELLGDGEDLTLRYIPYCSVGERDGVIPAVRFEKMCIHRAEDNWVEAPVIGICEQEIFPSGEYEMLLNPRILGGI